jgi:hypothetical protein
MFLECSQEYPKNHFIGIGNLRGCSWNVLQNIKGEYSGMTLFPKIFGNLRGCSWECSERIILTGIGNLLGSSWNVPRLFRTGYIQRYSGTFEYVLECSPEYSRNHFYWENSLDIQGLRLFKDIREPSRMFLRMF